MQERAQERRACHHPRKTRHHRLSQEMLVWEAESTWLLLLLCDPNPVPPGGSDFPV